MTRTAVIGQRIDDGTPDTGEIEGVARTAGFDVVASRAAVGPRDKTYNLPPGLVADLSGVARAADADAVVVDNELTPSQAFNLAEELPEETLVVDRRRLILDLFARRAGTKRARLEVQLARLEYELPRARARVRRDDAQEYGAYDEEGKEVEDIKRRIDETKRKLAAVDDPTPRRIEERRDAGFDLVALAGYTNAGKTTLLRRLADELSLDADAPGDVDGGPAVRDRLFETLGTTTRRATLGGRTTLVTDTVGFVRDLPHDLVTPFEATLAAAFHADVVLLVVDATDTPGAVREKVSTCRETLDDAEGTIVPVLNKVDAIADETDAVAAEVDAADDDRGAVDEDHLRAVRGVLEDLLDRDPVLVSAEEPWNLDELRDRVLAALPADRAAFRLPNDGETMSFVSWAYDALTVRSIDYDGSDVSVEVTGRPSVVAEARRRAAALRREPAREEAAVHEEQHDEE